MLWLFFTEGKRLNTWSTLHHEGIHVDPRRETEFLWLKDG